MIQGIISSNYLLLISTLRTNITDNCLEQSSFKNMTAIF